MIASQTTKSKGEPKVEAQEDAHRAKVTHAHRRQRCNPYAGHLARRYAGPCTHKTTKSNTHTQCPYLRRCTPTHMSIPSGSNDIPLSIASVEGHWTLLFSENSSENSSEYAKSKSSPLSEVIQVPQWMHITWAIQQTHKTRRETQHPQLDNRRPAAPAHLTD